jgi:hypothetical protein
MNKTIELLDIGTFRVLDYTFKYETTYHQTFGEGQDFYFHKFKTSHPKYGDAHFIVMTTTKMLTMRRLMESLLNWASITMYHDFAINLEEAGKAIMEVVVHNTLLHTDEWANAYREMPLASLVFEYAHNTFYVDCLADIELAWQDFNSHHGNIMLATHIQ